MKIVIIGTGNAATVLARLFFNAGNQIVQVFGRTGYAAEELASELHSVSCNSWNDITWEADIYVFAIADRALYEVENHLKLPGRVVLHTAGSVSKEVLKNISDNYGVLYPLQSLRKEMPVLTQLPLLADASNQYTLEQALRLAGEISDNVSLADDQTRFKIHLAAVCINNFTNHLYEVAEDFCKKEDIQFGLLLPLLLETARRMEFVSPQKVLTGPAMRNDDVTINRHLQMLESYPLFQRLYDQLTKSIRAFKRG